MLENFLQQRQYLILGTGTDVGKTFLVTQICKKLRERTISCDAVKPVASGFSYDDLQSDSAKILQSLGLKIDAKTIDEITPYKFAEPLSPSVAARKEGKEINFLQLLNFCEEKISVAKKNNSFLFVEAAGGVMTPINDSKTFLDLAQNLQLPVLLVCGNYLGAISHTLCAVEVLMARGVAIEKIIVNNFPLQKSDIAIYENIGEIRRLSSIDTMSVEEFLI